MADAPASVRLTGVQLTPSGLGHNFTVEFSVSIDGKPTNFHQHYDDPHKALAWVSESLKLINRGIFPLGIPGPLDGCPLRVEDPPDGTHQIGFAHPGHDTT